MEIRTSVRFDEKTKKEIQQKLNAGMSAEEIVEQMNFEINFR